jgi:lipopolysaccharide/colanic/teichoic acid biosynthesis glycosyltransferase
VTVLIVKRVDGKRLFDIVISAAGIVILSPIFGVVAIAVKLTSPGPVIYRGRRVGLGGLEFEILKFRTMWDRPSRSLTTALDDPRITPLGRWLRRHKIDELPQLINVLRGDMSFVGPRPEFLELVNLYGPRERVILSVRPGITDFASLEFFDQDRFVGRSNADEVYLTQVFARKNELRVRYVEQIGWATDARLIFRTIVQMARRR